MRPGPCQINQSIANKQKMTCRKCDFRMRQTVLSHHMRWGRGEMKKPACLAWLPPGHQNRRAWQTVMTPTKKIINPRLWFLAAQSRSNLVSSPPLVPGSLHTLSQLRAGVYRIISSRGVTRRSLPGQVSNPPGCSCALKGFAAR